MHGIRSAALAALTALVVGVPAAAADLTFLGWADQHVQTSGDGRHLEAAIDAMNALPGRAYPEEIGGKVARPAFVIGAGDITEWPTHAARDTYHALITKRLKYPLFDILGNHDSGGKAPSDTMERWMIARHGGLSYTFVKGGVRFVMLHSRFDADGPPAQPVTEEALAYLRKELSAAPKGRPVVVVMHLCLDAVTNRSALVDAFGSANVILVLAGHYHKATAAVYRGIPFVQLPSPAPGADREVTVLRISADRIVAVPFDYARGEWTGDSKRILDVRRAPRPAAPGAQ